MLHAIGNHVYENFKDKKIIYLQSPDLVRKIYPIVNKGDQLEKLKDEILSYDVVLIDDIQFMQGKEKMGEILFYAYDKLIEAKKIVIIASDKTPDELHLEERVTSRLGSGLVQSISHPDLESIKKIISLKLKHEDIQITSDGIE
jgi:chromosomal replication initiator protein